MGRTDPENRYLTITGRLKEIIISGGVNVFPGEIEAVIDRHEDVECSVEVGIPPDRWGEMVVASVVPKSGRHIAIESLDRYARALLSPHKCPKRYVVSDSVPVNEMGKVARFVLVQELTNGFRDGPP